MRTGFGPTTWTTCGRVSQDAYASLCADVAEKYGVKLTKVAAMGFSAMMHGYLPLDGNGELLAPSAPGLNTMTAQAAEELTGRFGFNIPQRWSIAHLYQAILNGEEHVKDIVYLTTLAGLRPLQAHRREGPGRGGGQRHVPHRQRLLRL